MTDSTLDAAPAAAAAHDAPNTLPQLMQRLPGVVQGARWFWWIAGLSAVNVACDLAHADFSFVMGLAFTQLAHAFFQSNMAIALVIDAVFIGGFYLIGLKAQQGQVWPFVLGVIVYLCDALIYMKLAAWLPVGFHALALFYIGRAYLGLQAAKKATGIR